MFVNVVLYVVRLMPAKRVLEEMAQERAPGPRPSFSVFDLVRALEILADSGPVGRGKVAEKMGLGKGVARTMIERMRSEGVIRVAKVGCELAPRGHKIWMEIKGTMSAKVELREELSILAKHSVAVLVKDKSAMVEKGLEQRDAAVKVGARGAITLVFRDNSIMLPSLDEDLTKDYSEMLSHLVSSMNIEDGDVLIISGADEPRLAEIGALAAAWTLI